MKLSHSHVIAVGIFVSVILLVFGLQALLSGTVKFGRPEASKQYIISSSAVSDESRFTALSQATFFNVSSGDSGSGLYTLPENSAAAVVTYLSQNPSYSLKDSESPQALIPDDPKNIVLTERLTDSETNFLQLKGVDGHNTHYYFQQVRCTDVPIYGSYIQVHVNQDRQVYSLAGALAQPEATCDRVISAQKAEEIAMQEFQKIKREDAQKPSIRSSSEYVLSPQVSGNTSGTATLTRRVEVCAADDCYAYFVNLKSGHIDYSVATTLDALNRYVRSGSVQRREGDPASSNANVNKAYDIFGTVYNFYKNAYNQDSFDKRGGMIQADVVSGCPDINATWTGQDISVCSNSISLDVLGHEFQHAVTQYAVDVNNSIEYVRESGGLNEGISDIFAATMDSKDWTMGEDTIRVIRDLSNPPKYQQPDTLFSPLYVCVAQPVCRKGSPGYNDCGGVHTLSGVVNKAFYLMSDGGTFPATQGCTMTGIGREKANKVVYKALTTYLKGNIKSNFRDMYDAMNQACTDLFQVDSAECTTVKTAMQSVAMDQSEKGQQNGAKCRKVQPKPLTCLGNASTPTPAPTVSAETPTPAPSESPSDTPEPTPSESQETPTPEPSQSAENIFKTSLVSPWTVENVFAGSLEISKSGSTYKLVSHLAGRQSPPELKSYGNIFKTTAVNGVGVFGRLIGEKALEIGEFTYPDTGGIEATFETTDDLSAYSSFEVYFPSESDLPELPLLVGDVLIDSPQNKTILAMTLKFQGIDKKPYASEGMLVRVGLRGGAFDDFIYKKVLFKPDDKGLWHGTVGFDMDGCTDCTIRIKGPRHLQKKYCENKPTESQAGENICDEGHITLKPDVNTLDFSGVSQLAGDANQDGVVNSQDILFVRYHIGSTNIENTMYGDYNSDGVINAADDALGIYTLRTRTDR